MAVPQCQCAVKQIKAAVQIRNKKKQLVRARAVTNRFDCAINPALPAKKLLQERHTLNRPAQAALCWITGLH